MASSPDIATLSINDFEPHLNAIFEMESSRGMVPLTLAKTESAGQAQRAGGAFSLLFVAPAARTAPYSATGAKAVRRRKPLGGKLNGKMRISATKGLQTDSLRRDRQM